MHDRDLHVHTKYCNHAKGEMEDYVRSARKRGLSEVGFLAHVEVGIDIPRKTWLNDDELDIYWEEGQELKKRYKCDLTVSLGLELGFNQSAVPRLREVMARRSWDRIGLAYHFVPESGSLLNICSQYSVDRLKLLDQQALTMTYYQGLLEGISIIKPDFVCHLDVVRKRMEDKSESKDIKEIVRRIIERMAAENVALEINTAGYGIVDEPYPAPWILTLAIEHNLKFVLGSDSHHPDQVGRFFSKAVTYIAEAQKRTSPKSLEGPTALNSHMDGPYISCTSKH